MCKQISQYCAGFCGFLGIVRYCAGLTKLCGPAPAHPVRRPALYFVKKNFYKPFRMKGFRFHVINLIRCDRTCQRSITITNKEKSFTPNNSPLSHYSLLLFCLKESSRRDLSEHVKILLFYEKMTLFSVADTLRNSSHSCLSNKNQHKLTKKLL